MLNKIQRSGWAWLPVILLVMGLDRLSKYAVLKMIALHESVAIFPGFHLTLWFNTGAAFSFLRDAAGWQTYLFSSIAVIVSVVFLVWLRRLPRSQVSLCLALTLVIGGALGNLWDRLTYGYVIDFIDWYIGDWHWPVFNIADASICVGALLLGLDSFKSKQSN